MITCEDPLMSEPKVPILFTRQPGSVPRHSRTKMLSVPDKQSSSVTVISVIGIVLQSLRRSEKVERFWSETLPTALIYTTMAMPRIMITSWAKQPQMTRLGRFEKPDDIQDFFIFSNISPTLQK